MSGQSAIEWTEATWNPCYALTLAKRLKAMGNPRYQRDGGKASGPGFGVTLHEDKLTEPLRWRKPRVVFVNSMSDLFHEEVPDEFIARVFAVMAYANQHTFQVLTKRPERMRDLLKSWRFCKATMKAIFALEVPNNFIAADMVNDGFHTLDNIWLGVTIENRRFVHRADVLRETPAAVRFISAEPLLGPLVHDDATTYGPWSEPTILTHWRDKGYESDMPDLNLDGIDWLICGGESGPNHRRFDPQWARDLREACARSGTAFFFKQHGGVTPKAGGRELDGRTWDEMPVCQEALSL